MNKRFHIRKMMIAVAMLVILAVVAVVMLPSSNVEAASNCTYYSNAQHTVVVGQFGYDCCNNRVSWGAKTAFKVCGGCFPCVPPPR